MSSFRPYHSTNEPGRCIWCGNKLPKCSHTPESRGSYGDGFFCGLSCGYMFAVLAAKNGYRFEPKDSPPVVKRAKFIPMPKCPECGTRLEDCTSFSSDGTFCCCVNPSCVSSREWLEYDPVTRKLKATT